MDGVNKLTNNQTGLNVVANGGVYSRGASFTVPSVPFAF